MLPAIYRFAVFTSGLFTISFAIETIAKGQQYGIAWSIRSCNFFLNNTARTAFCVRYKWILIAFPLPLLLILLLSFRKHLSLISLVINNSKKGDGNCKHIDQRHESCKYVCCVFPLHLNRLACLTVLHAACDNLDIFVAFKGTYWFRFLVQEFSESLFCKERNTTV